MVVLLGRRSKVLPAVGRPCRGRDTSRRWRAARNVRKNRAAGGVTVLAPPGSSLSLLAPTQGATTRLATDSAPGWTPGLARCGAGPRRLMLGTLAPPSRCFGVASACLRFRRQLGRCRRSALLNVGPRLAATLSAHAPAGGYRRPVRSARLLVFCLGGRARLLPSSAIISRLTVSILLHHGPTVCYLQHQHGFK